MTDCTLVNDTEIILLLDTAKNQTFDNYSIRQGALRHFIDTLLSYNSAVKIGMYSYSDDIDLEFPLSWSNDKDKLKAAVMQVSRNNYLSVSNYSHALAHIGASNVFSSTPRKIILTVSDGDWSDNSQVKSEILKLSGDGIDVFALMAGDDVDHESYADVLEDPSYGFYIEDDDYSALDTLAATTKRFVCISDIFTKRQ